MVAKQLVQSIEEVKQANQLLLDTVQEQQDIIDTLAHVSEVVMLIIDIICTASLPPLSLSSLPLSLLPSPLPPLSVLGYVSNEAEIR